MIRYVNTELRSEVGHVGHTPQEPHRVPPLRAVREAQGLTLRQAARLADVDPSQLSKAERGIGSLSVSQLARLAHVLGLRHLARQLDRYAGPMP